MSTPDAKSIVPKKGAAFSSGICLRSQSHENVSPYFIYVMKRPRGSYVVLICLLLVHLAPPSSALPDALLIVDMSHLGHRLYLCITNIIDNYFNKEKLVPVFVDRAGDSPRVEFLLRTVLKHLTARTGITVIQAEHTVTSEDMIIFINSHSNIFQKLRQNPRARCVISVLDTELDVEKLLCSIFMQCWELGIVNVVVLVYANTTLSVYTFFPFSSNRCGSIEASRVDVWEEEKFSYSADLFPDKVSHLYGCQLKVSAIHVPPLTILTPVANELHPRVVEMEGIEGNLLQMVADHMDFRALVQTPHDGLRWGYQLPNGSWVGACGELYRQQADLAIGGLVPTIDKVYAFEMSTSYYSDQLVWCVPIAKLIPAWKNLILPLSSITWLCVAGSFILAFVCILLFVKLSRFHRYRVQGDLFAVWSLFLGVSAHRLPLSSLMRFVCLVWMLYSLIVTSSYQGSLISFLTSPKSVENIETMKELVESRLPIGGSPNFKALFDGSKDPVMDYIHKSYEILPHDASLQLLNEIALGRDFATVIPKGYLLHVHENLQGKGRAHIPKEVVLSYPLSFYMPRSSPYLSPLNKVIRRIFESGFVDKWRLDLVQGRKDEAPGTPVVLSLSHLMGVFVILVVGAGLSVVIFLSERLYYLLSAK